MDKLDVVALGGHAILPDGTAGPIDAQIASTTKAMEQVAELLMMGRRVVLTHGNGPIVGNILLRNDAMRDVIPPMPLDVCGADSQGGIGYIIQRSLRNVLAARGTRLDIVSLVTQVRVSPDDPAFLDPTKTVGPHYSDEEMRVVAERDGWHMIAGEDGKFRRAVPSPYPLEIVEMPAVKLLIEAGVIAITLGGGGIPVMLKNGEYIGCEAVIDKDLSSSLLARELDAERLLLLTSVDAVYEHFGTENAKPLRKISLTRARALLATGSLPVGSMGAKIQAAMEFVASGGAGAVICQAGQLRDALDGRAGTTIVGDA